MPLHLSFSLQSLFPCILSRNCHYKGCNLNKVFKEPNSEEKISYNITFSYLYHNASLCVLAGLIVILLILHAAILLRTPLHLLTVNMPCHFSILQYLHHHFDSYWALQLAWHLAHDNLVVGPKSVGSEARFKSVWKTSWAGLPLRGLETIFSE